MKPETRRDECGAESCSLCGCNSVLQASHIIPKFVGKWIKDTSATGFLARADDARRVQDLHTLHMLCSCCEQRFSRLEKLFADKMFHPFHKNSNSHLEYGSWLESFAVSLGWRVLKVGCKGLKLRHPAFCSQITMAETTWREFLLGDRHTVHPYESHLFFLGDMGTVTRSTKNFNMYSRRSTDHAIVVVSGRMFTYAKLADMAFVTSIHPAILEGCEGTRINKEGVVTSPRMINDYAFWEFLQSHVEELFASVSGPSPEVQQKQMQKALKKDPEKFLGSDSVRILTDEMVLSYKRKMAHMPSLVICLVDVIWNQVAGTKAETMNNIWRSKRIFDALAALSENEAVELDNGIRDAVDRLRATGRSAKYHLTANSIRITFIANRNSTKEDQRAAIEKELARLGAGRANLDTPIAIFSLNDSGNNGSFESGFAIP